MVPYAHAQNQGNIWYFGEGVGLDFSTTEPTVLTDGQIFANPQNFGEATINEGSSVISSDEGELLFYTNGEQVWNREHGIMPNGSDLMGMYSSTQSSLIIPKPGSDSLFYVFTTDGLERDLEDGMRYSIVNMCLDDGLGDVLDSLKNTLLIDIASEKLAAVKHENGTDVWIVGHRYNDDAYYSFLLTEEGLEPPIITEIGSIHQGNEFYAGIGQMKINSAGTKLAMVFSNVTPAVAELFDFDSSSGVLSNTIHLNATGNEYGLDFSLDGTKLYVTNLSGVHQFNLTSGGGTEEEINASKFTLTSAACIPSGMQLAPNGKIYISRCSNYLAAIEQPNLPGVLCGYTEQSIVLGSGVSNNNLPNFLSGYSYDNSSYNCDWLPPKTPEIELPELNLADVDFCSGSEASVSFYADTLSSYNWTNSAGESLISWTNEDELPLIDTTLIISASGEYILTLTLDSIAISDTLTATVYSNPVEPFSQTQILYCLDNNEPLILNALNEGFDIAWSNGSNESTFEVEEPGLYSVFISNPNFECSLTDSIEIVSSCGWPVMESIFTP